MQKDFEKKFANRIK